MSYFWEEFKDLFKTDSRREEERRQEINNALQAEKELSEHLANYLVPSAYDLVQQ